MKIKHSLAFGLLFGSLALPCFAAPPYNVDLPGILEAGHSFIMLDYTSTAGGGKDTETLPLTYKYGISRDFEFKFDTAATTVLKNGKGREGGLGDSDLQLKWRFVKETKTMPAISIAYKLKVPTANAIRGLGSGVADDCVWVTAGKSFKRFGLYGNLGYAWLGASKTENYNYYGVVLTYQLTEHLMLGAQYYGNSPKAPKAMDELAWGLGATYNYAPNRTLYVGAGKSEHGFSNFTPYVGLGFNFK